MKTRTRTRPDRLEVRHDAPSGERVVVTRGSAVQESSRRRLARAMERRRAEADLTADHDR